MLNLENTQRPRIPVSSNTIHGRERTDVLCTSAGRHKPMEWKL